MTARRLCIIGLLALASVQSRALWRGTPAETGPVSVGADLSNVRATSPERIDRNLTTGTPLLLLVFDPACPHSQRISADWTRWLRESREYPFEVVAVSPGPVDAAVSYAEAREWGVAVAATDGAIVHRTPWVFALDRSGQVVAEGHGVRLHEVAEKLAENVVRTNHTGSKSWRNGSS